MRCLGVSLVLLVCCQLGSAVDDIGPYKQFILDKHNELRTKQQGSNMQKMMWSDDMQKKAEVWVTACKFEHEGIFGENLAFNTGTDVQTMMEGAFQGWYDEIKTYDYNAKSCGRVGSCHYTQLVWHNTREVGCAMRRCPALARHGPPVKDAWYFACWYTPKGNDASEYPYLKGAPCSECWPGQTCEGGLCVGGKEPCVDKSEHCELWNEYGECDRNPKYMHKNCKKSCKQCE